MRPLNRKQKILGFLALAALGLLLAPFVAVQVQEQIFRYRAEHLLANMRSLMMHKANAAEIQAVFQRWDPNGNPCWLPDGHSGSVQNCHFHADSGRPSFIINPDGTANNWSDIWEFLFLIGGGRNASVRAVANTEGDSVPHVWFSVDVEISLVPKVFYSPDTLSGWVSSNERFPFPYIWQGLTLHPNYLITQRYREGKHSQEPDVYVKFGSHADPADIARLTRFDLSCLTRFMPCRAPEDIMPEAAAQFAKEEPQLAQVRKEHVCGPDIVGLVARESVFAGVVELTGIRTTPMVGGGEIPFATVLLIENLGPASKLIPIVEGWKASESRNVEILDASTDRMVTSRPPPEVHLGNHFILLAQGVSVRGPNYEAVTTERCGIVPLNPGDLELVRRAIADDLPPAKP